jgi:heme-degrading monooxygenase HmoA
MHARLSRFAGLDPERVDETVKQFEQDALPGLEAQQGFLGITAGVNQGTGQAFTVTLWETEENMRASERLADEARSQAVETAGPQREPVVDHYEVVVHRG